MMDPTNIPAADPSDTSMVGLPQAPVFNNHGTSTADNAAAIENFLREQGVVQDAGPAAPEAPVEYQLPQRDPVTGQFVAQAPAAPAAPEAPAVPATPSTLKFGDREVPIEEAQRAYEHYQRQSEYAAQIESEKARIAQEAAEIQKRSTEAQRMEWELRQERANMDALRSLAQRDPEAFQALVSSQALQAQAAPAQPAINPASIQELVQNAVKTSFTQYEQQAREQQFMSQLMGAAQAVGQDPTFGKMGAFAQSYVVGQMELARQAGKLHPGLSPAQLNAFAKSVTDAARMMFTQGIEHAVSERSKAKAATTQQIPATSQNGVTRMPAPAQQRPLGKWSQEDVMSYVENLSRQYTQVRE